MCQTGRGPSHPPGSSALPTPAGPRAPARPQPWQPGCQGLLGLHLNLRPRIPGPRHSRDPANLPDSPGKALPTSRLPAITARSLSSSSHLTARQPHVGTSADAYTLSLQQFQLGPGRLGRPWGGGAELGQERRPAALQLRQPAASHVRAPAPQGTPLWPRPRTELATPLAGTEQERRSAAWAGGGS